MAINKLMTYKPQSHSATFNILQLQANILYTSINLS